MSGSVCFSVSDQIYSSTLFFSAGLLISPYPDQKGNKLMFMSEWCEFPSAPCLARKKTLDDSSRLDVVEIARVTDMLPSLFPSWSD